MSNLPPDNDAANAAWLTERGWFIRVDKMHITGEVALRATYPGMFKGLLLKDAIAIETYALQKTGEAMAQVDAATRP